jgi:serine/threonine-protein kinase
VSNFLAQELKRSKYRLLGLVGQGQFGRVYCAIHRKTGRLVALKELDKHRFPTHKFLRELRFLLSLQHLNIVTCHALEHTSTGRYLVMDYCEGGTLRNLMEEDVRLHPAQCLKLVANVLSGLAHAHDRGIIHCDIKPENILLTLQPDGWTARVSDFGIARLSQELQKGESGNTGSPAYMAPERFYGQHFHSSDLYAVGILLYELLVGSRPFSGDPATLMAAHLNLPVKIPASISEPLQTIILTALQKLPARRFRSAAEMLALVEKAMSDLADHFATSWTGKALLQSGYHPPLCVCISRYQEKLPMLVRQLVGVSNPLTFSLQEADTLTETTWATGRETDDRLYRISGNSVACEVHSKGLLAGEPPDSPSQLDENNATPFPGATAIATVYLPKPVQQIAVRPQGCFAITQRSVYLIPEASFPANSKQADTQQPAPHLVTEVNGDFIATVEPQGRWLAILVHGTDHHNNNLSIWQLSPGQPSHLPLYGSTPIIINRPSSHLFQLLALDSRHIAAFFHAVDPNTSACITGVGLEIFTRRGNSILSMEFPVPLRHVMTTPTPYRLIATEPGHPGEILLIDLKPLRMRRVGIEISPALITTASWGYVLVDLDGQIVLLNQYGEELGRIQGPPNPTAVTVLEPHGLLLATWRDCQGNLHAIDLRQLDLDILF